MRALRPEGYLIVRNRCTRRPARLAHEAEAQGDEQERRVPVFEGHQGSIVAHDDDAREKESASAVGIQPRA